MPQVIIDLKEYNKLLEGQKLLETLMGVGETHYTVSPDKTIEISYHEKRGSGMVNIQVGTLKLYNETELEYFKNNFQIKLVRKRND